jgi:hypothetical protein
MGDIGRIIVSTLRIFCQQNVASFFMLKKACFWKTIEINLIQNLHNSNRDFCFGAFISLLDVAVTVVF